MTNLTQAVTETLHRRGTLGKIRANIRNEIFQCLRSSSSIIREDERRGGRVFESECNVGTENKRIPPELPAETALLNDLILEYLRFNGYDHTVSTFVAETSDNVSYCKERKDTLESILRSTTGTIVEESEIKSELMNHQHKSLILNKLRKGSTPLLPLLYLVFKRIGKDTIEKE